MIKLLLRISAGLVCISLALSCETITEEPITEHTYPEASDNNSDIIPLDEAMSNLKSTFEYLYGTTKALDTGYSIQTLTKSDILQYTKSDDGIVLPDTLLYLVNFAEERGYAVLSASRKLSEDTYCITESGKITTDDLRRAVGQMNDSANASFDGRIIPSGIDFVPSLIMSSVILESSGITENDEEDTICTKADEVYGPFVKTKWGQTTVSSIRVFNRYTPNHAACGCVVTAVAQIMLCNKFPQAAGIVFDGFLCNWTDMEKVLHYSAINSPHCSIDTVGFEQVAHFVRELGKSDNVKVRYGDSDGDESSAYAEGAQRTFQNYGYRDVDKHLGFGSRKQKIADKVLRGGRPVYLDGYGNGSGHAWVLDGLKGDYYHINWGWYGMSDGYYSKGVFRTSQRSETDSIVDTQVVNSDYRHYYKNFRMVTYGAFNN